jgi:hypothetical protein
VETAALEYLRVCDASGSAFLVVPGTDACLVQVGPRRGGADRLGRPSAADAARSFTLRTAGETTGLGTGRAEFEAWIAQDFLGGPGPERQDLFAYTATFGDGFSVSVSFLEPALPPGAGLGTIASWPDAEPIAINGISAPAFRGGPGGEIPEIAGNLGQDQPLGTVQLDAAALRAHAGLFTGQGPTAPSPAYPIPGPSNTLGLGVRGGVQPNMDYLSAGDRLWLQAAYENGAYTGGAANGTASASTEADAARFGRVILAPFDSVSGWRPQARANCAWSNDTACEHRSKRDAGADEPERSLLPTFSSGGLGSPQDVRYSTSAIAGFGGAVAMPKLDESRGSPSFVGMPISGFDIGAEFMYINVKQARPAAAPATSAPGNPAATGTPPAASDPNRSPGRLRVQRAF